MKAFFYNWPHLGDGLISTPIARQIHKMGYEIHLIEPSRYMCAFENIKWITQVVPREGYIDYIKDNHNDEHDVFVMPSYSDVPQEVLNLGLKTKTASEKQLFQIGKPETKHIPYKTNMSAPRRFLLNMGLDPNDCQMEIGFEHRKLPINKNTVLINLGADTADRRFDVKTLQLLVRQISQKHNVLILGGPKDVSCLTRFYDFYAILEGLGIPYIPATGSRDSLINYLNYIRESLIFITPDGGLLHAAAAMKHPTIYLETYYPAEVLVEAYPSFRVIKPGQRYSRCAKGCTYGDGECIYEQYAVGCMTDFDPDIVVREVEELSSTLVPTPHVNRPKNKPLLATVADDRPGSLDRVKSLFASAHLSGWQGEYLVLHCGTNTSGWKTIEDKNISVHSVESPFSSQSDEWFKQSTWNKLHLFSEEYKKWRPILYLDADMLAYDSFQWIHSVSSFGAVRAHHPEECLSRRIHNCTLRECVLPGATIDLSKPLFNAGVIVIGPSFNTSVLPDIIEQTKRIREYCTLRDQSVLSALMDWEELPERYNYGADVMLEKNYWGDIDHDTYSIVRFSGGHHRVFSNEFAKFRRAFDDINFATPVARTKSQINFTAEESLTQIGKEDTLYSLFDRAWPYVYHGDSKFKSRNPDPDIITVGDKIRVPGWFNAIRGL